jgi:hypothetical protein
MIILCGGGKCATAEERSDKVGVGLTRNLLSASGLSGRGIAKYSQCKMEDEGVKGRVMNWGCFYGLALGKSIVIRFLLRSPLSPDGYRLPIVSFGMFLAPPRPRAGLLDSRVVEGLGRTPR